MVRISGQSSIFEPQKGLPDRGRSAKVHKIGRDGDLITSGFQPGTPEISRPSVRTVAEYLIPLCYDR
jgi:hypothetical protein